VSRTRWTRVAAITAAALAAWCGAVTAPAHAAATNSNSCQYSYDGYWRDMDVTVVGTPSVTSAQPGDTITLGAQDLDAALPAWLSEYGYNLGLLQAGRNEIPVKVWIAIRGTNTTQGVQYHEVETVAVTTITTNGATFLSATPIEYTIPAVPDLHWTARGGPVEFRQGGSGTLPQLPVGPNGRLQQPRGSLYIEASLGQASIGFDCVSGVFIAQGAERTETAPAPFATVDVPSFTCLSALPAASNAAPVSLDFVRERGLPAAHEGQGYSYAPAVRYSLPSAYLHSLFDAGRLAVGDNVVNLKLTAAVSGVVLTGTAQAMVNVSNGGATIGDLVGTARLSPWTGTPTTTVDFAAGVPGALGPLSVDGVLGTVRPYGSLYGRVTITPPGGSVNRLSLDCVSGKVTLAGGTPPAYSELGNQATGDAGRYVIAANTLDPFATTFIEPKVTEKPIPTATATPAATASPAPTVTPAPTVVPAKPGVAKVKSTKLKVSGSRVSVSLSCTGGATCKGTLSLKTAAKLKLGKKAKRIITLSGSLKYSVAVGKSATVRLSLSKDARSLLKTRKKLSVRLAVKPATGSATSKALTLSK
jgi:hypothetical protein